MPDPDWLQEATEVTDEPEWLADAEKLPKQITPADIVDEQEHLSLDREQLSEEFVAEDRAEGGRARGRMLEFPVQTGIEETPMPHEAVLYEPAEEVRQRTPGLDRVRDDSVTARAPGNMIADQISSSMPGLSAALRYMSRDVTYSPGAMAAGAGQAVTFGHLDELAGAVSDEPYDLARDRARARNDEVAAEQPDSYLAGTAAGALTTALLPGPATAQAVRQAGRGARVGASVGEGVGFGALAGSGFSEEDVGSGRFAGDVATGALAGGATAGAMQGVSEAVPAVARRALPDDVGDRIGLMRLRALFGADRPPRRTWREMTGPRRGRPERVERLSRELEEAGVRGADQAADVNEAAGEAMGDAARQLDEIAAQRLATPGGYREGARSQHVVDPNVIAHRIRQHAEDLAQTRGVGQEVMAGLEREAQRWRAAAREPMTFQRAWEFRKEMGRPEYWTVGPRGEMNPAHAFRRQIYDIIREEMGHAAESVDPQLAQQFQAGARRFSATRPLAEAADEAQLRGAQNRQMSLTDTVAAGAGLASGGLAGGVMMGIANKLMRGNEHRMAASGLDALRRLAQRNPAALGPYGHILGNAMRRGQGAFAATQYALSQRDPRFRQLMEQLDEGGEDSLLYGEPAEDDQAADAAGGF